MMKRYIIFLIAISMILLAAGCSSDSTPTDDTTATETDATVDTATEASDMLATGTVEFRATDAPPEEITSVVVTVDNIQVHKSDTEEDSWITVVDTEKTFDLVLIQGAEEFLGTETVEVGQYTQIRLDVTNVDVTIGGETIPAELPSDKLKVVRNWEVTEGETTILTLDFEADKFVIVTGAGRVQVMPVIKLEVTKGPRPLKAAGEDADTEADGDGDDDADADGDDDADADGDDDADADGDDDADDDGDTDADADDEQTAEVEPLSLTSTAFAEGETIPVQYTGDGQDISPALTWDNVPEGTHSFAVIVDDPDAPSGSWVHWVLFDLPADTRELAENLLRSDELESGARQGTNGWGTIGYRGPYPPPGESHRYPFTLYALDSMLELNAGASMQQVIDAMAGHILGEVTLTGYYY